MLVLEVSHRGIVGAHVTKHLRVIPNAWHSYSIAGLYVYGGMIRFRGCVVHPLTGC